MTRALTAIALTATSCVLLTAHDVTTRVTWDREVERIVRARCVTCHRANGPAPMALETYEQARPWARAIRDEVLARRMPKWHAARGFGDFANDPSLSPFEIALINAWVEGGAPKSPLPGAAPARPAEPVPAPAVAAEPRPSTTRRVGCDPQQVEGRLLAVHPRLGAGGAVLVTVHIPARAPQILVWVRGFEPAFADTYWLRVPVDLPRGSTITARGGTPCQLDLTFAR